MSDPPGTGRDMMESNESDGGAMALKAARLTGRERLDLLLEALDQGWKTYRELGLLTEKPERTVRRDLDRLREQGYRLETRWEGGTKRFRLEPGSLRKPIEPGVLEVIAANLGRGLLGFLHGTELSDQMEGLFAQLRAHSRATERQLRDLERKFWFMPDAPRDYRRCDDHLNDLVTCILAQRCADISYRTRDRNSEELLVEPYTLVIRRECLYVLGQVRSPGGEHIGRPRPFDVTRIIKVRRTRLDFVLPDDWEPSVVFSESFGMFIPRDGEPPAASVRIWFAPPVGKIIQERLWHPSQQWSVAPQGGWHLDMKIRLCPELVHWILGFGSQARVVRPRALEADVRKELHDALELYQPEWPK